MSEILEMYMGARGIDYEPPKSTGVAVIDVLEFLWGGPWSESALDFIHALRPSMVRVTPGEVTSDGVMWRVTVYVNDGGYIKQIEQEVEIGLQC